MFPINKTPGRRGAGHGTQNSIYYRCFHLHILKQDMSRNFPSVNSQHWVEDRKLNGLDPAEEKQPHQRRLFTCGTRTGTTICLEITTLGHGRGRNQWNKVDPRLYTAHRPHKPWQSRFMQNKESKKLVSSVCIHLLSGHADLLIFFSTLIHLLFKLAGLVEQPIPSFFGLRPKSSGFQRRIP